MTLAFAIQLHMDRRWWRCVATDCTWDRVGMQSPLCWWHQARIEA